MHIPISLPPISSPFSRNRGRNKLNLLLFEEDWVSAITEIECHPNETKLWTTHPGFFDGDHESHVLPIHVACSLHAPVEVIRAIVRAHPQCVSLAESSFKRLPLHIACQFAARIDVIEYLSQMYASGTMAADLLGRLPLHYACSNGAPLDVVDALIKVNPSSVLYADYNGWIPLHVAVHFGAGTVVVKTLVDQMPPMSAETSKTKKGSTALKLAQKVKTKNREEVVRLLSGVGGAEVASDFNDMSRSSRSLDSNRAGSDPEGWVASAAGDTPQIIDLLDIEISATGGFNSAAAAGSGVIGVSRAA
mmetsp:Transcript_14100/g.29659  ORF Transcript_14100/g.29659 Transcript_14100/m.29659 type:complete len:305 (+) Transcript_14100:117-1031(+)|eukprot:CAMPEP_0171331614 /NCGR_PEP_ID=MMETSP0878-20121228/2804_1 /TAXON_ID=67004 /ORGANISM="Thalassiosira weissflogii, Strain CCMP1336" /LENGTH=304 /DNA_ID=CAMNT_0011832179 /DNA_START=98 /DNA_END=1012 /DNA_ORIENTATION=-